MVHNQPPVMIKTRHLKKERLDVEYPLVEGLLNKNAEHYINSVLISIVNTLIEQTDYFQNPMTEVTGRYYIRTNNKGLLGISVEMYWFFWRSTWYDSFKIRDF